MRCLIVPGHGGSSKGAVSPCGRLVESAYVLDVGLKVVTHLRHMAVPGLQCDISRTDDDTPHRLSQRVAIATEYEADLVLSLHVDAGSKPEWHGLAAYYWPGNLATYALAEHVTRAAPFALSMPNRHAKSVDDRTPRAQNLLRSYPMAAMLIEFGYVTHARDVDFLLQPQTPDILANLVVGCVLSAQEHYDT